ncbi:hypothetical protein N8T08_007956 [Aspergillus melleus]|uniref:Uncharacterized protein n=1 Tax=Aspergillus melleus TaxID=138277 RepID=A0ACC3AXI9_9EURO|nr:hypothetical protein N8T08_007956 [Aspergillus melleus]
MAGMSAKITRVPNPGKLSTTTGVYSLDLEASERGSTEKGTGFDENDMTRMGKAQEFKRNLRPFAAFSFASVLQATWEFILISNYEGLRDGGLAGLFWTAPTSGGQYHWVSEFASPQYQGFLSYITGWMSVLAWQAGAASGSFLTGTIIQGLISIHNPDYDPQKWQGTLFVFAMIALIYFFNVYAATWMPRIQNLLLYLHILFWAVVIVVLWAMAPRQPAKAVFTEFSTFGGWNNVGLTLMIGQISAIYGSLSSDATAHMSEEVRDAGRYVPIAIVWGYFSNGLMALVLIITLLFAMPSVQAALHDPTGFPFIYVFAQALPQAGVNGLTAIILIPVIFSNILFNASTARQTYAFARDKGLPFSNWICTVNTRRKLPVNAIGLSCVISGLLSLINIGSETAFNAIISLNVAALMWTYAVSITCVIWRKVFHPETLPSRRWSLGRYGVWINFVALLYTLFALFWSFWPTEVPVTLDNFNWSVVLFGGIFIISLVMYVVVGRRVYEGPVVDVKRAELGDPSEGNETGLRKGEKE